MDKNEVVYREADDISVAKTKLHLEAGWLGRVFGAGKTAQTNIAALALILLLLSGIASTIWSLNMKADEYWKIIAPLVSLIIGFIFGKGSS